MTSEELQEVKVLVPVERVGQIYEMVARWHAGPPQEKAAAENAAAENAAADERYKPWSGDDLALARKVWNKLSPSGRELFSTMDQPEQRVPSTKLTEALGAHVHGVEGWPARHRHDSGPHSRGQQGMESGGRDPLLLDGLRRRCPLSPRHATASDCAKDEARAHHLPHDAARHP